MILPLKVPKKITMHDIEKKKYAWSCDIEGLDRLLNAAAAIILENLLFDMLTIKVLDIHSTGVSKWMRIFFLCDNP
jgi:hypothetical protein